MIVVKTRAVGENEVALDFFETERAIFVDFVISRFVRVLEQRFGAKPASIQMRILQLVIPFHVRAVIGIAAHQLDRFGDDIDSFGAVDGDAVFRLETKDAVHASRQIK